MYKNTINQQPNMKALKLLLKTVTVFIIFVLNLTIVKVYFINYETINVTA